MWEEFSGRRSALMSGGSNGDVISMSTSAPRAGCHLVASTVNMSFRQQKQALTGG